jgi:hypothetical protein
MRGRRRSQQADDDHHVQVPGDMDNHYTYDDADDEEDEPIVVSTTTEEWISNVKTAISSSEEEDEEKKPTEQELMEAAPPLHRVGASIGNSTIASLLENVPDVLKDEEDGIVAMFSEIHRSLPEPPEQLQAFIKSTLAHLLAAWTAVKSSTAAKALTDDEYGVTAMFKELGDSLPKTDVGAYLDALFANMVLAYYGAKSAAKEVPQLLAPEQDSIIDDDVSLAGMFKEVAHQFPGVSEKEAESYMVNRFKQVTEEAASRRSDEVQAGSARFLCA